MSEHAWDELLPVDEVHLKVIVDNVSDGLSSSAPCFCCHSEQGKPSSSYRSETTGAILEKGCLDIRELCNAAHGFSVLLTVRAGATERTCLFDAGPSGPLWTENAAKLGLKVSDIDAAVLSHWHPDHSEGLVAVAKGVQASRLAEASTCSQVSSASSTTRDLDTFIIDVHPDRPACRGIRVGADLVPSGIVAFNPDPSFSLLEEAGASIRRVADAHTLLDNLLLVSGYIPRLNAFEQGMANHVRWVEGAEVAPRADEAGGDVKEGAEEGGRWVADPDITDERYLVVKVRGRGLVVLSGCSHAGIVNVVTDAKGKGGDVLAVVGGFHLAGREAEARIHDTVASLVQLDPAVIIPGHCSGWRAVHSLLEAFPGRCMPCTVGSEYSFRATSTCQ